ncbi:unnamed protein product [Nezara viridula]|uniref:GAF domain-containing protein n=1 Tax=Nezara viridula TaxID=85310 RepID=A0A9P0HU22_NEZVI|nr:unnamed protein product [Nezara viridula]
MVETGDENMSPRDITILQKNYEKKAKKSRKFEFLKLLYSNPQKLLHLIKELYDDNTIFQQIKVNLYLQAETGCALSFLIEKCLLYNEHVIKVIGSRELATHVRYEKNNEFIKRLEDSEGPITLMKELLNKDLLLEMISISYDFGITETMKYHFFPIFHPYRKNVIFYSCLVQDANNNNDMETLHGYVGECFRYCQEIIVNTMRYDEQRLYHSKQKKILDLGISNLDLIDDFTAFLPVVRQQILELSEAERCNIFLLEGNVLVSRICDYGVSFDTFRKDVKNVRIPVGVGVSGTVAKIEKGINCLDPNTDPLYQKDLDVSEGLISRNMLSFPLMLYGRVYGVAEVYNKTTSNMFSSADVNHCECLGRVLGIQLYMALVTKKNRDDYSRRNLIDFFMLKNDKAVECSELRFVDECQIRHDYHDLVDYMFIPSSIPTEHNMCACLHMFEDLDLLQKMGINRSAFISEPTTETIESKQSHIMVFAVC